MYPLPQDKKLTKKEEAIDVHFIVPADGAYFGGHFPSNPLVPAVIQTGWALASVSLFLEKELPAYKLSRFKFLSPIRPSDELRIATSLNGNAYKCVITRGEELCCSGTIIVDFDD